MKTLAPTQGCTYPGAAEIRTTAAHPMTLYQRKPTLVVRKRTMTSASESKAGRS